MPNTSSQSHFDIGNSWSIDATPTVANVSTNFYGMVANNCVTMMCIIKISINVHCKSYIKLQSKFTPAMIAITYAKPKAGVYWESSPLMCPLIFILPVPCLSTLHLNLSINSNCKSAGGVMQFLKWTDWVLWHTKVLGTITQLKAGMLHSIAYHSIRNLSNVARIFLPDCIWPRSFPTTIAAIWHMNWAWCDLLVAFDESQYWVISRSEERRVGKECSS